MADNIEPSSIHEQLTLEKFRLRKWICQWSIGTLLAISVIKIIWYLAVGEYEHGKIVFHVLAPLVGGAIGYAFGYGHGKITNR